MAVTTLLILPSLLGALALAPPAAAQAWYEHFDFAARGAVAYWPFDGDAQDKTGNGNDGYWTGGSFTPAVFGSGHTLSPGVYYRLDEPHQLDTLAEVTLAAWFKASSLPMGDANLLGRGVDGEGGSNFSHYFLFLLQDGGIQLDGVAADGSSLDSGQYRVPSFVGVWHHYAVTFDGSRSCAYVDGLRVTCAGAEGRIAVPAGMPFYINRHDTCCGSLSRLSGVLDEAVVFNRALHADEIAALATDTEGDSIADFWQR